MTRPDHERRPDLVPDHDGIYTTPTLVDFLRARLDEDEQIARRTLTYLPGVDRWEPAGMQVRDAGGHLIVKHSWPNEIEHIARHDPARVLADVEAKRRIAELHGDQHECASGADAYEFPYTGCETLRLLALPYAVHVDYRDEWRTES